MDAAADVVMVIRHGEKPSHPAMTHGVTLQGRQDKESLTPTGWIRAGALLALFAPDDDQELRDGLYRPASLFASNTRGPRHGSQRQEQTVALLSWRLGVKTNLDHGVGEEHGLLKAVEQAPSPRLICWEHRRIPTIGTLLGSDPPVPPGWPGRRYDMVYVFARDAPGEPYTLTQVPELLLPGDSDVPIG